MIATTYLVFLGVLSVVAFYSGRHALSLILVIGFTQDMVRKLTPGQPILFIVTVGLVFAAVLLGIWMRRGFTFSLEPFLRWSDRLREPMLVFLLVLLAQFIYSIVQYGNLTVALIGLTTYIAPFLAVIVGYYLAVSVDSVRTFLKVYAAVGLVVALSVLASFAGYDLTILNEVGVGIKIYDQDTVLKSYAGIMRTGEVAAWHLATATCLWIILAATSENRRASLLIVLVIALLLVAVALTGRRKMLMLVVIFTLGYFSSFMYYRKALDARYFTYLLILAVAGWIGFELLNIDNYNESLRNYIARSSTVFADASGRFVQLGINPIQWAYNRVGLLGGGLGIASQGSYLFDMANIAGGSGEGGLGKIMVELGLPGLLCIIWLVIRVAAHVDRCLHLSLQPGIDSRLLPIMLSLSVLIGANAMTFSVATQVYGDIFILILLGLMGGFVFALPKIALISISTSKLSQAPRPR